MSEVYEMSGAFRFETFVDAHSNIFNEYLSSVIAKLPKENEEYKAVQDEIESLYGNCLLYTSDAADDR